jgi:hypothetical protein
VFELEHLPVDGAPPPPVALASHVSHRGLQVTVHRPVLGSLVVAEGDGEPPIVAVDDFNAVVSWAAGTVFD